MTRPLALILTLLLMTGICLFDSSRLLAQETSDTDEATSTEAATEPQPENEEPEPNPLTPAEGELSPVDTLWVLIASAFVLLMTAPGLALFYGGLVRKKNILGLMMQCVFLMGLMTLVWFGWGYSLAFGTDLGGGLIGGLDKAGLMGVLPYWDAETNTPLLPMRGSIPEIVFDFFQFESPDDRFDFLHESLLQLLFHRHGNANSPHYGYCIF